jgi:hypothetical protein
MISVEQHLHHLLCLLGGVFESARGRYTQTQLLALARRVQQERRVANSSIALLGDLETTFGVGGSAALDKRICDATTALKSRDDKLANTIQNRG